jgi:hypothetical protein
VPAGSEGEGESPGRGEGQQITADLIGHPRRRETDIGAPFPGQDIVGDEEGQQDVQRPGEVPRPGEDRSTARASVACAVGRPGAPRADREADERRDDLVERRAASAPPARFTQSGTTFRSTS